MSLLRTMSLWPRLSVAVMMAVLWLVHIGVSDSAADTIGGPVNWGAGEGPAGDYDFPSDDCTGNHTDPVGVLFVGKRSGVNNVSDQIEYHAHWTSGVGNLNPHSLLVRGADGKLQCHTQNYANANAGDASDRFHVRLWNIPGSEFPKKETVGTPHHEDWVFGDDCFSHAVDPNGSVGNQGKSGFDWARHQLRYWFSEAPAGVDQPAGNHIVETEDWGNNSNFKQCNGKFAGSDGSGLIIWVNNEATAETGQPTTLASLSTFHGKLKTGEAMTEYWFGYGPRSVQGEAVYPHKTTVRTVEEPGEQDVDEPTTDLAPNHTYYVRMFVRNEDGDVEEGNELAFTTPPPIPVAAYSFDEGEGATVSDLTGHGHTATIEGAQWSAKGRYGGAMEFDVADQEDVLKVPDADDLDLTEDFTLEAWVRPLTERAWATVIGKEDSEESSFSYLLYSQAESGGPGVELRNESTTTEEFADDPLPIEAWSHIALTSDGGKARLYVDGVLVKTSESFSLPATDGELSIGGNGIWGEYFDGRIDEVRIYDRTLTAAEIEADRVSPLQTPQEAPVAAYSFDEGEGTTAEDLSGDGHTATIEGAEWSKGKFGSSLKFDGEGMVTIPASEGLNLTEEFTVEAWIKPEPGCEFGQIFVKEDAAEEHSAYVVARRGSRLGAYLGVPGVEAETSTGELERGVWRHVAVTYNGDHARLYVNGQLAESAPAIDVISTDGALRIGGSEIWGPGDDFTGRIDEVRVYNRALSEGEVTLDRDAALQTPSAAPVAAYSFDEGQGSTVADLTGHGHTATIEGPEWTGHGRYGSGMQFDAEAESMLSIADADDLDMTEDFTLEAWVRPESEAEWQTLFTKEDSASPNYSYLLYARDHDARLAAHLDDGEDEYEIASEPAALRQRAWAHVALTFDGAKARLYIDGELVKTCSAPQLPATDGELVIGGNNVWGEYFNGRIDEVRIYDRVLSEAEVGADKDVPLQTPQKNPIAAYSFDEGEGASAEDDSGNGQTATIEGAEWVRGRYGSALEFDAAEEEDVVKVPDSPDLDFSEEFTLEAWVRPSQINNEVSPAIFKSAGEGEGGQSYAYRLYEGGAESNHPMAAIKPDPETTTYVESGDALPEHAWSHIAMTYDGSWIRIFVDGEEVNSVPSDSPAITNGDLEIGAASALGHFFDGRVDEVRVYNRALSEGEIARDRGTPLKVPAEGPVAAYSFDEGEGTTVEDLTGHSHTATIEGPTWTTRGHFGNALEFKGEEGECVTIPDSEQLSLDEELTVEAWVKPSDPLEDDPILYKDSGGMVGYSIGIGTLYADQPEGWLGEGFSSFEDVVGPEPLESNVWARIAMTFDGAKMRLYVNGELVDTAAPTSSPSTSGGDLKIGCNPNDPEVFNGRIDEVRIYNRALEAHDLL